MTVTEAFTKNSFVDKCMKLIPDDPLTQSQFIYYLTVVVFLGLLGYGINAWYNFFAHSFQLNYLFSGLFMVAIALISAFGLKQTRTQYITMQKVYGFKGTRPEPDIKLESVDEMKNLFKDEKVQNNKSK